MRRRREPGLLRLDTSETAVLQKRFRVVSYLLGSRGAPIGFVVAERPHA